MQSLGSFQDTIAKGKLLGGWEGIKLRLARTKRSEKLVRAASEVGLEAQQALGQPPVRKKEALSAQEGAKATGRPASPPG